MDFLEVLLIILIFFVLLRLIFKFFGASIMRWLGRKALERMSKSFEKRSGMNFNDFNNAQEPESRTHKKVNNPTEKKVVGEYVDFEEID